MYFLGRLFGYIVHVLIVLPIRFVFNRKPAAYHNTEELKLLQNKSFIIAANHIKPQSRFLRLISMPYDAYLLHRMFTLHGIQVTAFTSIDSYKRASSRFMSFLNHRIKEPLIKGIVKSLDLIPLNRRSQDKETTRDLRRRLEKGGFGVGIFPEGTWYDHYDPQRKLQSGMGVFGKRYKMPILPVYLNAYDLKGPIDIRIGRVVDPEKGSKEVVEEVRRQFVALKEARWHEIRGSEHKTA